MDRDLEPIRPTSQFPEANLITNSALSRTYDYLNDEVKVNVLTQLNGKVDQLLQYSRELANVDPITEEVTRPLEIYSNGIVFESMGEAGLKANDYNRTISLNMECVACLAQKIPKEWLHIALLVFLCHEASHIAQKIKDHQDVQRIKAVGREFGQKRMGELDLRSDFLATHTLSLFLTLRNRGTYNRKEYIRWFHQIWCYLCRAMLDAFPCSAREDKQQRVFGYLLMANLISDSYESNYPLEFEGELWPEWSASLDWLSIFSNSNPLIPGHSINPETMGQVLASISEGEYDVAAARIRELWRKIPRR
jgi:hypothetical protein